MMKQSINITDKGIWFFHIGNITDARGVLDDDDWRTNLYNDDWKLIAVSDIVAGKLFTATVSALRGRRLLPASENF